METLRVGIIGTGKKKPRGDATGYAMAYRHGRVDLPLTISDHPLLGLLASGELHPAPPG